MQSNNPQWVKASIAIVIMAGLLGALSVISEGIGLTGGKLFTLSLSLILFGINAVIAFSVTRKPGYQTLGLVGVMVSGLAFLLVAVMILGEIGEEFLIKTVFTLFIASIALAHIALLHYFNLRNKWAGYARMTATVFISLFSFLLILRVFEPFAGLASLVYNQSTLKILVASLVIDLAATLLVPLCNLLKAEEPPKLSFTEEPPATSAGEERKEAPME